MGRECSDIAGKRGLKIGVCVNSNLKSCRLQEEKDMADLPAA